MKRKFLLTSKKTREYIRLPIFFKKSGFYLLFFNAWGNEEYPELYSDKNMENSFLKLSFLLVRIIFLLIPSKAVKYNYLIYNYFCNYLITESVYLNQELIFTIRCINWIIYYNWVVPCMHTYCLQCASRKGSLTRVSRKQITNVII